VGVSRYSSTHLGLVKWWLDDPAYLQMIERELTDGQHRLPDANWPGLFTTAFFHRADELQAELEEGGLVYQETLAVQGPGWLVPEFEQRWNDEAQREILLSDPLDGEGTVRAGDQPPRDGRRSQK
jgi:hypothetical protein